MHTGLFTCINAHHCLVQLLHVLGLRKVHRCTGLRLAAAPRRSLHLDSSAHLPLNLVLSKQVVELNDLASFKLPSVLDLHDEHRSQWVLKNVTWCGVGGSEWAAAHLEHFPDKPRPLSIVSCVALGVQQTLQGGDCISTDR